MKNNTIAIALGSLLLGGVATAGYLNKRDKTSDIQPPSDAAAAQYADAFGEPLPMDSAIPVPRRVAIMPSSVPSMPSSTSRPTR